MDNREKMYDKIRALLSKTTANGCTEEEYLAALGKARALMDAHEITGDDLQLKRGRRSPAERNDGHRPA